MKSGGGVNHYVSGLIGSLLEMKLQDEILDSLIEKFQVRIPVLFVINLLFFCFIINFMSTVLGPADCDLYNIRQKSSKIMFLQEAKRRVLYLDQTS